MTLKEVMMKNIEEFEEKFKCIQSDCDGGGYIPVGRRVTRQVSDNEYVDDVEWEAEQCQFHAEYLDPIKSRLLLSQRKVLEAVKAYANANSDDPCGQDSGVQYVYLGDLLAFIEEGLSEGR